MSPRPRAHVLVIITFVGLGLHSSKAQQSGSISDCRAAVTYSVRGAALRFQSINVTKNANWQIALYIIPDQAITNSLLLQGPGVHLYFQNSQLILKYGKSGELVEFLHLNVSSKLASGKQHRITLVQKWDVFNVRLLTSKWNGPDGCRMKESRSTVSVNKTLNTKALSGQLMIGTMSAVSNLSRYSGSVRMYFNKKTVVPVGNALKCCRHFDRQCKAYEQLSALPTHKQVEKSLKRYTRIPEQQSCNNVTIHTTDKVTRVNTAVSFPGTGEPTNTPLSTLPTFIKTSRRGSDHLSSSSRLSSQTGQPTSTALSTTPMLIKTATNGPDHFFASPKQSSVDVIAGAAVAVFAGICFSAVIFFALRYWLRKKGKQPDPSSSPPDAANAVALNSTPEGTHPAPGEQRPCFYDELVVDNAGYYTVIDRYAVIFPKSSRKGYCMSSQADAAASWQDTQTASEHDYSIDLSSSLRNSPHYCGGHELCGDLSMSGSPHNTTPRLVVTSEMEKGQPEMIKSASSLSKPLDQGQLTTAQVDTSCLKSSDDVCGSHLYVDAMSIKRSESESSHYRDCGVNCVYSPADLKSYSSYVVRV